MIYASKRRLATSVIVHVVEALDSSEAVLSPTGTTARAFRPLGEVRSSSCSRSSDIDDAMFCVAWLCTKGSLQHRPTCEHNRHLHECRRNNSRSNKVRSFSRGYIYISDMKVIG